MKTAAKQLAQEEGSRSTVYQDHLGFWTIGVGICVDSRVAGAGIDEEEQAWLLARRLEKLEVQLDSKIPWWRGLTESRQAVLIEMAFQMGVQGLLGFKNTLAHIQAERYRAAATNMLLSNWAKQTPARARRMAKQMETGDWQAGPGFTLP